MHQVTKETIRRVSANRFTIYIFWGLGRKEITFTNSNLKKYNKVHSVNVWVGFGEIHAGALGPAVPTGRGNRRE